MNHTLRMLLGCLLPLGLIFVLPLFGVGSGMALLVFVVLMFGCHLMMLGGHASETGHGHDGSDRHDVHGQPQVEKESADERSGTHQHPQH